MYMNINPFWIAAVFECRNVHVRIADTRQTLPAEYTTETSVHKPFAKGIER